MICAAMSGPVCLAGGGTVAVRLFDVCGPLLSSRPCIHHANTPIAGAPRQAISQLHRSAPRVSFRICQTAIETTVA